MKEVLWLNKETLEERWLHPYFCFINPSLWVEVPDGATFATGDKDNFVFRKDGWYYDNQTNLWFKSKVTIKNLHTHTFIDLFWIKSEYLWGDNSDKFTLERLLGCEALSCKETFYIDHVFLYYLKKLSNALKVDIKDYLSNLTFFTEGGDELTFDEYVKLYYPCG